MQSELAFSDQEELYTAGAQGQGLPVARTEVIGVVATAGEAMRNRKRRETGFSFSHQPAFCQGLLLAELTRKAKEPGKHCSAEAMRGGRWSI